MKVILFPIYLDLEAKTCLIVGGGQVAERKIENLLDYGMDIRVVSPQAREGIQQWAEEGIIQWQARDFSESDLPGVFMAFVATDNSNVNQAIVEACRKAGVLVNAVDDPPNCDFYVPSIVRRGSLVLAISTEGKSPFFARRLREELENTISPAYGEFVEIMGEIREEIKEKVPDITLRKKIFKSLVYSEVLDLLKAGEKDKARERIEACMSSWLD
ncbi:MAG: bifunctional precorrin-2 dehydrogenase/sirohydrochlorin ferrochelatase [Syntrophomonas sp.]|uniref:precorrin-2 dehydrogenase/sirohydrochlorin ferrochelatase family protein n=1 Tax=Syntrophomonas sp. TaxID=2053627 RepID=UPI002608B0A1|nr:bifunctional precorrin-2 dehydrogenase/sirohydrochlorin ferrochelatase [Syntrophomonas sp.]MDD2510425.1 bifunctional precorrin-2 dehydrogenase/sirohydrochlorin ferrochelatase [Syntrophomonas sp.]MDD3878464.1 bifunctional precorrin-2 dehydrogenase/sirohydrochlorin ferrochelatase [Syntrophomonas sp.]MDD4625886.1 bifunctional precorrin-2 dehydrogenase/sirohydrochlorin ferrochelatase [Syntrophomonas sp.]